MTIISERAREGRGRTKGRKNERKKGQAQEDSERNQMEWHETFNCLIFLLSVSLFSIHYFYDNHHHYDEEEEEEKSEAQCHNMIRETHIFEKVSLTSGRVRNETLLSRLLLPLLHLGRRLSSPSVLSDIHHDEIYVWKKRLFLVINTTYHSVAVVNHLA